MDRRFINLILETRHYGGPEEGGWWYTERQLLACELVVLKDENYQREQFEKKWEQDLLSVYDDGDECRVLITDGAPCEEDNILKPVYE